VDLTMDEWMEWNGTPTRAEHRDGDGDDRASVCVFLCIVDSTRLDSTRFASPVSVGRGRTNRTEPNREVVERARVRNRSEPNDRAVRRRNASATTRRDDGVDFISLFARMGRSATTATTAKNRAGGSARDDCEEEDTADPTMMMPRSDSAMTFRRDVSNETTTTTNEKYYAMENSALGFGGARSAKPRSRLGDAERSRPIIGHAVDPAEEGVFDQDEAMTMVARRRWYTLVRTHALSDCATVAVNDAELAMLEAEILCVEGGAGTPPPRRRVAAVADVGGGATGRATTPDGVDLEEEEDYEEEEETVVVVGGDIWKTAATTKTTETSRTQDSAEDGATTFSRNPPAVVSNRNAPVANNASQQKPGGPCDHCGAVDSPQWRRGPASKPMLCNACGTRYRRTNNLGAAPSRSGTPEKRKAHAIVSSSNANSLRPGKKSARYSPAVERSHRTTVTC